jgi:UDP-N-acetylmuramate dehydrogenase
MNQTLYHALVQRCKGRVLKDELLSAHTSFRIGGPADCLLWAEDTEDLEVAFDAAEGEGCPCMIIGNGTNLLVVDEGIRGLVVRLGQGFNTLEQEGECVRVGGGVDLADVLEYCAEHGLGGLEFAAGIPGTVGGALYTDANTKTGWVRGLLSEVRVMGRDRQARTLDAASCLPEVKAFHRDDCIIGASFQLTEAPKEEIHQEIERYLARRRATQPIEQPSAGCIFQNPQDQPAGKLIDQCGCKGMRVGGAVVSDRHANFIVNIGGARSEDVLALIDQVRERVLSATGIHLALEVNVLGPLN